MSSAASFAAPSTPQSVAYLGPPSSYSHQATLLAFPPPLHTLHPCPTIADIFTAVSSSLTHLGVIPIENSTNGSVVFTLDLLRDHLHLHRSIRIIAETYLPVHHCLVSSAKSLEEVKKLYSHPQAWGQCDGFLGRNMKGRERVDVSSTSKAAELCKGDQEAGAISSKVAAEVNGLNVLAENIEDVKDNTTRFFVIRKLQSGEEEAESLIVRSSAKDEGNMARERKWKTLVVFSCDHSQPGALADALKVFKNNALNLTSINSRPSRKRAWDYVFFVEFVGHGRDEGVRKAVGELGAFVEECRVLGSYEDRSGGV